MKALEASMNEVGYTAPMIAAADGEIIAGSARHETAANVFGADVEPMIIESDGKRPIVVVRTDIKNADTRAAKRIGLLDNRVQEIDLSFDPLVLAQLYAEDKTLTAGLWSDDELTELLNEGVAAGDADAEPQIDKAAELNKVWQVETGDLWHIGDHRLLCGDSTKREDVERVMGGEKADAVVTDPPYGIGWNGDYTRFSKSGVVGSSTNYKDIANDNKRFDPSPWLIFDDVILWGANFYCDALPSGTWLVWDKRSADGSSFLADAELAWQKGGAGVYIKSANQQSEKSKMRDIHHPTKKPVSIILWCIQRLKSSGLILDPFLGSGTTLVACQNLNRKCRGIEISPDYCAVILQRMKDAFPNIEIKRHE
jgi:site-specific DNA-methyltransferase (adenine-specific)/modification methylase